jgi:hypothetical protein
LPIRKAPDESVRKPAAATKKVDPRREPVPK